MREERARRALRCLRGESECVNASVDVVDERRERRFLFLVRDVTTSTQLDSNARLEREQAKDAHVREVVSSVKDASRSLFTL